MTNEEAIEVLAQDLPCETDEDLVEAMAMAIKALETVSCIKEKCAYCPHCENCDVDDETLEIKALEQQTCEDCISRQAVEKMIKAEMPERGMWEIEGDTVKDTVCEVCADLMQKLSELPPVTPKSKSEYEHDHEVVKAYNDGQAYILNKIRAEIENDFQFKQFPRSPWSCGLRRALEIIDKYREVSE